LPYSIETPRHLHVKKPRTISGQSFLANFTFRVRIGFLCRLALPFLGIGVAQQVTLAQEKAQFAVIDYMLLFKDYYKALESNQTLRLKQEEMRKDFEERQSSVMRAAEAGKKLQEDLQSPAISDSKKKEIEGQLKDKQAEFNSRQKLFMDFRDQSMNVVQKLQAKEQEVILADINAAMNLVAKNKYTIVFSKSLGAPPPGTIVFNEGIDDITQQVLAILNKDAPKAAKKEDKK